MGEAALDELHGAFEGFGRGEEEMNVVRLGDEGVEFVCALAAVVLQGGEEEVGAGGDLEEAMFRCGGLTGELAEAMLTAGVRAR